MAKPAPSEVAQSDRRIRTPDGDLLPPGARLGLADMAQMIGVHAETFGERGDGRPGRDAAIDYAKALEILRSNEP